MTRYRVILSKEARRDLDDLPRHVQKRIVRWLDLLADDPRRSPSLQLEGHPGIRRVHASKDYVILYSISSQRIEVIVIAVANRRDVYRRM